MFFWLQQLRATSGIAIAHWFLGGNFYELDLAYHVGEVPYVIYYICSVPFGIGYSLILKWTLLSLEQRVVFCFFPF